MSVSRELLPLLTTPVPAFVPSLAFIVRQFIALQIYEGFLYNNPDIVAPRTGAPACCTNPKEVRERLYRYDTRGLLKGLLANKELTKQVLDVTCMPSFPALYCAMAASGAFEVFDPTKTTKCAIGFNSTDIKLMSYVGPVWTNLTRLVIKESSISRDFIVTLSRGAALRTLRHVDFSGSTASDEDLFPLSNFTNLTNLQLNYCEYISIALIGDIAQKVTGLKKLGLTFSSIPVSKLLQLLQTYPDGKHALPELTHLHAESATWSRHADEATHFFFSPNRPKLQFFSFIPDGEIAPSLTSIKDFFMSTPTAAAALPRLIDVNLPEEALVVLPALSSLKRLVLSCPDVHQSHIDTIARDTKRLKSLFLVAPTIQGGSEGLDFSSLQTVRELSISDAQFGLIKSLPPNLESLVVSIDTSSMEGLQSLQSAIMARPTLKRVQLMSSEQDLPHGFPVSFMHQLLSDLPRMEHVTIDTEVFQLVSKPEDRFIRFSNNVLRSIRIVMLDHPLKPVPVPVHVPALESFEGNLPDSLACFQGVTATAVNLRQLSIRINSHRSSSTHDSASLSVPLAASSSTKNSQVVVKLNFAHATRNSYALRFLSCVRYIGATMASMPGFKARRFVNRFNLIDTDLDSSFISNFTAKITLRELEVARCSSKLQLDAFKLASLKRLTFDRCAFDDSVIFEGQDFRNLEVLIISNSKIPHMISVHALPVLRLVSLTRIRPTKIRIMENPVLAELNLAELSSSSAVLEAPRLQRLYIESAARASSLISDGADSMTSIDSTSSEASRGSNSPAISLLASESSSHFTPLVSISSFFLSPETAHLNLPELKFLSWNMDYPVTTLVETFKQSTALQVLSLPEVAAEDIEIDVPSLTDAFPMLASVSCSDTDIEIRPLVSPRVW